MSKAAAKVTLKFDGFALARGWCSVAVAAGTGAHRPQLFRATCIEQHAGGVYLAATDSYILLWTWVPEAGSDTPAPELDTKRKSQRVALDGTGLALSLFKDIYKRQKKRGAEPETVVLAVATAGIVIDRDGEEQLTLPVYDGDWPDWRDLVAKDWPASTGGAAFNTTFVARVAQIARYHPGREVVQWAQAGPTAPARFTVGAAPNGYTPKVAAQPVHGLLMPVRVP